MTNDQNIIHWIYGGFAIRHSDICPRRWFCMDSDYKWESVTDDFGNLITIESTVQGTHISY